MAAIKEVTQRYVEDFPIDQIVPHPDNPRIHDDDAMDESLEETGFTGTVVLQESTKHLLDGHGRVKGLKRHGVTTVPVMLVDCDDRLAKKILLNRNRPGEKAGFDSDLLASLLDEFAAEGDLIGTGYNPDFLDDLLAESPSETAAEEFKGGYVEDADEAKHRAERKAVTKDSLGLREVVLVYNEDNYEELRRAVAVIEEFHSAGSTSEAVLAGVVNYAKSIVADS